MSYKVNLDKFQVLTAIISNNFSIRSSYGNDVIYANYAAEQRRLVFGSDAIYNCSLSIHM